MATLFNTKISATYEGLLKTIDNAAISATLKELTDGSGNQSGLYLNTAGDFKVTNVLEWGSLKDTGTGVTITRYVTSTDGLENFNNNTSLPTSAAVKLYVDTKFATSDTLQEVLSFGNTTSGNDIAVSSGDNITLTDFSKILIGASNDLQIYHSNPTGSFVRHDGTGNLHLTTSNDFILENGNRTKTIIDSTKDAEVNLYFNDAKKLKTTNTGISVTGIISNLTNPIDAQDAATKSYVDGLDAGSDLDITDGTNTGDVNLNTQTLSILGTTNEIETVVSGQGVTIGLPSSISTDLVGNVTGNLIGNVTGNVTGDLTGTASKLEVNNTAVDQNERVLLSTSTGSQDVFSDAGLLFNPVTHLLTVDGSGTFTGDLTVTGNITGVGGSFLPLAGGTMTGTNGIKFPNNFFLNIGVNNDLQLHHDGSNSYITDSGTGSLILNASEVKIEKFGGDAIASFIADGEVELYYNNAKKFATTNTGISVTGNVVPTGNVHIQDAGQLILGASLNGRIYHDGSNFYANNSTGQLNIDQSAVTESIVFKTSDANALDTTALIINRGGDLITGRDVTIAGDLTVNGTTTTVNSQTLSVDDPLISLAINNAANSLDIGYYGKYNDGTTRYLGLYNDASDSNKFKLFKGTTVEPTTTVNIGAAGYAAADLELANLVATGNVTGTTFIGNLTGDVTGNLQGNVTGDVTGNVTGNLTGTVNSASVLANGVTATTQTAGDNSTKVATTAYANAAASAIPIGDYLPLIGGTLTGPLTGTTATFSSTLEIGSNNTSLNGRTSGGALVGMLKVDQFNNTQLGDSGGAYALELVGSSFLYTGGNATFAGTTTVQGTGDSSFVGNVGIGTDSPDTPIDVSSESSTIASFRATGGASNNKRLEIGTGGDRIILKSFTDTTDVGAEIAFSNGNSEAMRIDTSGNVGIGTVSPDRELEVEGDGNVYIRVTAKTDNDATAIELKNTQETWTIKNQDTNDDALQFESDTVTAMTILKAGNVGIGTDSPDTKLHIADSTSPIFTFERLDTTTIANEVIGQFNFKSTDSSDTGVNASIKVIKQDLSVATVPMAITFETGVSGTVAERMRITSAGDVGIGTDSPSAKLDVKSLATTAETVAQFGNGNIQGGLEIKTDGNLDWGFNTKNSRNLTFSTNQTERMRITSAGDVTMTGNVTATDFVLSSDIRLKKDLLPLYSKRLSPTRWTWRDSGKKDFGFIAQELEVDFPEVVITGEDGFKKVAYNKITAINSARINELEDEVCELKIKLELIMQKLDI